MGLVGELGIRFWCDNDELDIYYLEFEFLYEKPERYNQDAIEQSNLEYWDWLGYKDLEIFSIPIIEPWVCMILPRENRWCEKRYKNMLECIKM